MTVGELMEALECMTENALALTDYNPGLELNDVTRVYLTGFDEYNPVVSVEANRKR